MGEERRITDLTAISAFRANDYIAVDNASEAQTKKLPASAITGAISAAQTDATRALNIARSTSSFPTGDAYSSSSSYKVGDMIIYNNTLYRCKTACSPASWSVNASNFEATSLASALTDLNNELNSSGEMVSLGASASSTHISIAFDETQYKRLGLSVSRSGFTYAYTEVDYQWFKANKTTAATGLGATHYASTLSTQLAAEAFYNTSTGKVEIWASANGQCSAELFGIK